MSAIRKRKLSNLLNPVVLLVVFLFFYFVFLIRADLVQYFDLKAERRALETSLAREEMRRDGCARLIEQLDRPGYIEELARLKLGMIKKGEVGYKVY